MTALSITIAMICGFIIGTGVTLAWEWQRMRITERMVIQNDLPIY